MKDFLYEKVKAEHWKERALIADARIAALEAALRRIDAINDSPARFSKDIHDVIAALAPEPK